jgi:hypothetical protein
METVLLIMLIFIAINVFFYFRNEYVYVKQKAANKALYRYGLHLIEINQYDGGEHFETMKIAYGDLMFDIARWGKYCAIKDEYMELIKPYFK